MPREFYATSYINYSYLVCEFHVNSVESNGHFLTTVKLIKHYFQYFLVITD